jgi:HK97 family phage major capsid protein
MVMLPVRPLFVRDLLTPGNTTSNAIEYPVETSDPYDTRAAVVSETQRKPQSNNVALNLVSTPVRTIAHFMKASRQIMDDAPMLQSYIDGRLRFGLQYVEELELLSGDGTGQHLHGIIPQATAYAAPFAPDLPTTIDTLRLAALQATLALYPATGYVMHPTDWAKIELTKDTLGRYIVGNPQGQLEKRLWTLPVVDTQAMAPGHFLAGAFKMGAQIFDRQTIEVLISTENEDDFVKNMITIRAEERLALAVYRPAAFTYGAL